MFRVPLVLSLTAVVAGVTAVALPAGATPPGSNGKLLFERPTRDGADLFTVGADGSGLARLTRLRGVEGDASWSPDGSKVAFARQESRERPIRDLGRQCRRQRPQASHPASRVQLRPRVVS